MRSVPWMVVAALVGTGCVDGASRIDGPDPASLQSAASLQSVAGTDVVVILRREADRDAEARFVRTHGGAVGRQWSHAVTGFEARVPASVGQTLAARSTVALVESSRRYVVQGVQACAPYVTCNWGLDRIDETMLPLDGNFHFPPRVGSTVHGYVIDTGIRISHLEFGGRAVYGIDVVDNDAIADDCNGHGTSMASLMGGAQFGVAKGLNLVAVRALDCLGAGSTADIISAVDWVTTNAILPAVANMSLGGPASAALDAAVSASIAAGIVYVASAGGSGSNACGFSPGRVPAVVTVGGTGSGAGVPPAIPDDRTPSSNVGPCLDLFAPGANILSAGIANDAATIITTGTSNSSALVGGAAALYLDYFPAKTPAQVATKLVKNASIGVVGNPGPGSPNRLLNIGVPHRP